MNGYWCRRLWADPEARAGCIFQLTMRLMPQAQIRVLSLKPSEQEVAAHRRAIEAGGDMRVLGDPEIRRVRNDDYITTPDAPIQCYLVIFQVEPA